MDNLKKRFTFYGISLLLGLALTPTSIWAQFIENAKIQAGDKQYNQRFGISVSISGDRAIVGALNKSNGGSSVGAAYIFERNVSGVWTQVPKLQASDKQAYDNFGYSVSISGDHAIVGAAFEDTGDQDAGAAYIFERNGSGNWTEVTKLQASDRQAKLFGYSVSISGDHAIVGTLGDAGGGAAFRAAYIFARNGSGVWTQVSKLQASDQQARNYFGCSVSISGNRAIVGSKYQETGRVFAGAAYIFERNGSGVWTQVSKLQASDKEARDYFGESVSISGDHAIVGASREDTGDQDAGAAYIFERNGSGVWTQVSKLQASDKEALDYFGESVSISGDHAIVGAPREDTGDQTAGAVYIFARNGSGAWIQVQKRQASDKQAFDYFGHSVSISGDSAAIVGMVGDDFVGQPRNLANCGAAYIFGPCVDEEPPTITCPSGIISMKTLTVPASVSLSSPTVIDACDASPVVSNNAPESFPRGNTQVIWTARDKAGNTSTCSQTVSISLYRKGDQYPDPASDSPVEGIIFELNRNVKGAGGSIWIAKENDLPNTYTYTAAMDACTALGDGWELPDSDNVRAMRGCAVCINNSTFNRDTQYWMQGQMWFRLNWINNQHPPNNPAKSNATYHVRPVREINYTN